MNRTRPRLIRAVRGIVFLCILAAVVLYLDGALKLVQEDNLSPRYYKYPEGTFDAAFLGASLVMYGIYPMELYEEYGIAAYNLSTGNQSLEASYYLAKEVIEKDHPSLIVLDCSRALDDEESMEPQYIHYLTDTMPYLNRNRIEMIRELSAEGEDTKPLLFPLIAFHSRWQELTFEDALPQTKGMVYGAKVTGRVEVSQPFKAAMITPHVLTDTSRLYIEKTIELCRDNDTQILLLTMPVIGRNKFFDQHGFNLRASAAAEVAQLAEENGVLHANYLGQVEELGMDLQTDAYDGEHLNRWGARKMTRVLGQYIRDHFEIPDRRGTGGIYAQIEEDLALYPVSRMKDSLRRSLFLRDYAATLASDAFTEPVEDAVVLVILNGKVDSEILTEEDAALLQSFGLQQNLHDWQRHAYLAVIDGGEVIYESPQEKFRDFTDSFSGRSGKVDYEVTSGRVDEETGEIHSAAAITVNGLSYATADRGLHFAVFQKSTGDLLDECWLNIFSRALNCTHDNH